MVPLAVLARLAADDLHALDRATVTAAGMR